MTRKRISLTLDENLVERIDMEKSSGDFSNRSRAVESFLNDYFSQKSVSTAVILCGGDDAKKCLNIVKDSSLLHQKIRNLEDFGVERVFIATGEDNEKIEEHVREMDTAMEVKFSEEDSPMGTAGCLRKIKDELNETFILTNGDVLCNVDIRDMLDTHRKNGSMATMALTTIENTSMYGVVKLKGDKIVGFEEKPEKAPTKLINAGMYMLEPGIIKRIEDKDEEKIDMEEIFSELTEEGELRGYVYEGSWYDMGN